VRSAGDVYQLTSYVLALETTGVLVYPSAEGIGSNESIVAGEHQLRTVKLPTSTEVENYEAFTRELETAVQEVIEEPIE
jgi:5-methylcytosine-specific restriction enzyme subunit McrC